MKSSVMTVTPEMATKWLSNNPNVRALRNHRVLLLANAIRTGHFKTTHQGIAIREDGALLDGQHRLAAIVRAGLPTEMMVTTGVPASAGVAIDSGMPRQIYERIGADRLEANICATLLKCAGGRLAPQEYEVELCIEIFSPFLRECEQEIPGWRSKNKTGNPSSLAAMLLLVASRRNDEELMIEMKKMMAQAIGGDLYGAPQSVINFYKQSHEGVKTLNRIERGSSGVNGRFCRAWIAMKPENKSLKLLLVRDPKKILSEAIVAFNDVTDGVFCEGDPKATSTEEVVVPERKRGRRRAPLSLQLQ